MWRDATRPPGGRAHAPPLLDAQDVGRRRCRGRRPLTRPAGIAPPPLMTWLLDGLPVEAGARELGADAAGVLLPLPRWQDGAGRAKTPRPPRRRPRRAAPALAAARARRASWPRRPRPGGAVTSLPSESVCARAVDDRRGGGGRLGVLLAALDAARGEAERGDQRHQRESRPQPAHDRHPRSDDRKSRESIWGRRRKNNATRSLDPGGRCAHAWLGAASPRYPEAGRGDARPGRCRGGEQGRGRGARCARPHALAQPARLGGRRGAARRPRRDRRARPRGLPGQRGRGPRGRRDRPGGRHPRLLRRPVGRRPRRWRRC